VNRTHSNLFQTAGKQANFNQFHIKPQYRQGMEEPDMYFDKPGKDNTDQTLTIAAQKAKKLSID
jgi:hypothetical protein